MTELHLKFGLNKINSYLYLLKLCLKNPACPKYIDFNFRISNIPNSYEVCNCHNECYSNQTKS